MYKIVKVRKCDRVDHSKIGSIYGTFYNLNEAYQFADHCNNGYRMACPSVKREGCILQVVEE